MLQNKHMDTHAIQLHAQSGTARAVTPGGNSRNLLCSDTLQWSFLLTMRIIVTACLW